MARLRWVKSLEQVKQDAERSPEFLSSTVRSLRVVYETSPALAAAVIPKPLSPALRPEVCATFSHVAMHITPEYTLEIGSAVFGVRAVYDGVPGIWLLTMPMTSEQAVIGGRETYGEPKKIAQIDFGETVRPCRLRSRGWGSPTSSPRPPPRALGPRELTEHAYCVKALPPATRARPRRLSRAGASRVEAPAHAVAPRRRRAAAARVPLRPRRRLPVRRLVKREYERGQHASNVRCCGHPGRWLLPVCCTSATTPPEPGNRVAGSDHHARNQMCSRESSF